MTTTNVFAELLIIGIETLAWIALLIFCLFGYGWIDFSIFNNLAIAIPLAAAAYVLGIIMDRVSDTLLAGPDHAIRRKVLGERAAQSFRSPIICACKRLSHCFPITGKTIQQETLQMRLQPNNIILLI